MTSIFFQTDFTYSDVAIWEEGKEKNSRIDYGSFSFFYYQQGNSIGLVKSGHLNAQIVQEVAMLRLFYCLPKITIIVALKYPPKTLFQDQDLSGLCITNIYVMKFAIFQTRDVFVIGQSYETFRETQGASSRSTVTVGGARDHSGHSSSAGHSYDR